MSNEYHSRYQHLSHRQLYNSLKAGSPEQIDHLSSFWSGLTTSLREVADALGHDVEGLQAHWTGSASAEYTSRLNAVQTYAHMIADDLHSVGQGLGLMSGQLRQAQAKAENPSDTDNNNNAIKEGVIGLVVAGPVGGVLGVLDGHSQDQEEEEKARQRMITLVANVAADYDMASEQQWPFDPAAPPSGLPGSTLDDKPVPISTGGGSHVHTSPTLHQTGTSTQISAPTGGTVTPVGSVGSGDDQTGVTAPGGPGTGVIGAAPTSLSGAAIGGAFALTAGGVAATVRGSFQGGAPSQTGSTAAGGAMGRPSATPAASESVIGRPDADRATALRSNSAAAAGRGTGEDEGDEHSTWLTEDDMDWGAAPDAVASVLGGAAETETGETDTGEYEPADEANGSA